MLKIEINNSLSHVWASPDVIKELDKMTSYPVEGAEYSQAFKSHIWDGREHLLRKSRKADFWMLPTGLLSELDDMLKTAEVVDRRRPIGPTRQLEWIGKPLREYQIEAADAALRDRGMYTCRGILNLPIRSGKTMIAAELIRRTGLRTLFVVPSDLLLFQTEKAFSEVLGNPPLGLLGAGRHQANHWITIATLQSMLARPKMGAELLSKCDLLLVDECHRLEGPAWRAMLVRSDAAYKIGLSATVYVSRIGPNQQSSIWLKACTGPILYRISMSRLIKSGHIMRPNIMFYKFQHAPSAARRWSWQKVAKECLAQNRRRNCLIADIAEQHVKAGKRVLIDTGRHDQMKTLLDYMSSRDIKTEIVHGKTPPDARWGIINKFQQGHTRCIIGTVFGEGVDIPELEVVINAEGQRSKKAAIQRMRNLTPSEGKAEVVFVDFADMGQPHLQDQSLERLKLYRGMRGFSVKVCEF